MQNHFLTIFGWLKTRINQLIGPSKSYYLREKSFCNSFIHFTDSQKLRGVPLGLGLEAIGKHSIY